MDTVFGGGAQGLAVHHKLGHGVQIPGVQVQIGETFEIEDILGEEGRRQLARVIRESIEQTNGRCKGVFYWEPECKPSQYKLGAFTEDGRPTVIMDAFTDWSLQ